MSEHECDRAVNSIVLSLDLLYLFFTIKFFSAGPFKKEHLELLQ